MRTIWQSLAWKEWHEHKWKLVALLAIMWGIALLPLTNLERGTLFGVRVVLVIGIVPLAIFIGLGTAAGERSRGTLHFLQALPVPMWRVALYKMAFGIATVVLPALLTLGLTYIWCLCLELFGVKYGAIDDFAVVKNNQVNPFSLGTGSWFLDSAIVALCVSGSFYLWTIAFGVNRKDEVSAGAVALATMIAWSLFLAFFWFLIAARLLYWSGVENYFETKRFLTVATLSTAPGGVAPATEAARSDSHLITVGLIISTAVNLALAATFVRRFSRNSHLDVRSRNSADIRRGSLDWLGPPRRSPFTSITWKQFRESGPIVLAALAILVGATAIFVYPQSADNDPAWRDVLVAVSMIIGFCLALVMGVGVVLNDVRPGINTFWRSRPINADLWFWTKFLCGLAILLVAIYAPTLILASSATLQRDAYLYPLMQIAIFAAAVAMTALVRQAVYAAILSIAVAYLGLGIAGLAIWIGSKLGWLDRPRHYLIDLTEPEIGVTMFATFVVCTLLAWLAVRNDWGQKAVR